MPSVSRVASIATVAAALAATGCGGGKNDYPAHAERAFLANCDRTSGGKTDVCKCALDKIEEKLSYDEFKKEDTAIAAGGSPSRKLTDAVAECR